MKAVIDGQLKPIGFPEEVVSFQARTVVMLQNSQEIC